MLSARDTRNCVSSGERSLTLHRELIWAGSCSCFTAELFIPSSNSRTAEIAGAEGSLYYLKIFLSSLCTVLCVALKADRWPQPVSSSSPSQIWSLGVF